MKRFHVHVAVDDLAASIRFYSALFDAEPTVRKPDYAKWMIDDPRINFAISARGARVGVNHLGLEVDSGEELDAMRAQLAKADSEVVEEKNAHCCYAQSDKYWIADPQGIAWETYHSLGSIPIFGGPAREETSAPAGCCAPSAETADTMGSGCCAR